MDRAKLNEFLLADNMPEKVRQLLERNEDLEPENAQLKADIASFMSISKQFIGIFGILDEQGNVKEEFTSSDPEIQAEAGNVILKGAGKLLLQVSGASVSKAEGEKLKQRFAFFADLLPLINKYGNLNGTISATGK